MRDDQLRILSAHTEGKRSVLSNVKKKREFQNSLDAWNRYMEDNWFQFMCLRCRKKQKCSQKRTGIEKGTNKAITE